MAEVIVVPFHQDDRLSDRSIGLSEDLPVVMVDPVLPDADHWRRLMALYDAVAARVAGQARQGGTIRVVSGDCLVGLATAVGLQRAGIHPGVVWFDAHGDVHTLTSSTSGYLGGMALRMVMGGDLAQLAGPLGLHPVAQDRVVLVGARDLDPPELAWLAASGLARTEVTEIGPDTVPDGPLMVHIDLDVIDPGHISGLRFPVPGGATVEQVIAAVSRLHATGRVAALDVACPWWDPSNDAEQSARANVLGQLLALA